MRPELSADQRYRDFDEGEHAALLRRDRKHEQELRRLDEFLRFGVGYFAVVAYDRPHATS